MSLLLQLLSRELEASSAKAGFEVVGRPRIWSVRRTYNVTKDVACDTRRTNAKPRGQTDRQREQNLRRSFDFLFLSRDFHLLRASLSRELEPP